MTQAFQDFLKTVIIPKDDLDFGKVVTLTCTETVDVTPEVYWSAFDDYFRLQSYVGMHENTKTIKGDGGVGTVIEFDFMGGKTKEELVEKDDATKTWAIEMLGSNPMFTSYKATVKVEEDTNETAKVTMTVVATSAIEDAEKRKSQLAFTKYMLRNRITEVLCLLADNGGNVLDFEIDVDCTFKKMWDAVDDWSGCSWVCQATGAEACPLPEKHDLRRKVFFGDRALDERLVTVTDNPPSLTYELGKSDVMKTLFYRGKVALEKISDQKTKVKYTAIFLPQAGVDAKAGIKPLMDYRLQFIKNKFQEK
uniref:Bet v I/Major latex protein domain-containing protein n=1 Tax=Branchiostoma floridae TaxID=7739 RepID=C3YKI1_BRAFL|eukprot:XP_002603214.1 hypothetical protein BRAFLDRAFT_126981 [Branchiostoma floridae]